MKYHLLGNTGVYISEICFGTMTFGSSGYWKAMGELGQKEATELVKIAVEGGVNFIDTANVYSFGQSETLLGKAIQELKLDRHDLVIATKVRGRMSEGANRVGLTRLHIFESVDASLKRMGLDHIDLLYVHGVDPVTPIEETMRSLNDIVDTGKVRYIAVCNWPAWMVMKANGIAEKHNYHKFVGMQYYYSIAGRDIEREILPLAQAEHLSVMPWSPLAGGFLSGKYTRDTAKAGGARRDEFDFPPVDKEKAYDIVDVMAEIGKAHGVSVAEIALAWVRYQNGITSTIIGARRPEQLQQNLHSVQLELSESDLKKLDEVSSLKKEYPQWMVEFQGQGRAPQAK